MFEINPQYEIIFSSDNIDDDCNRIAHEVDVVGETIKEILRVGMYKQAVTMYLQLLKSMTKHFWRMNTGATLTTGIVQTIL